MIHRQTSLLSRAFRYSLPFMRGLVAYQTSVWAAPQLSARPQAHFYEQRHHIRSLLEWMGRMLKRGYQVQFSSVPPANAGLGEENLSSGGDRLFDSGDVGSLAEADSFLQREGILLCVLPGSQADGRYMLVITL